MENTYVVVVGIVVAADSEEEAELTVENVLLGDRNSGVIVNFNLDYVDEVLF